MNVRPNTHVELDLDELDVTRVNRTLQGHDGDASERHFRITNAMGQHALAVGIHRAVDVLIDGHAGYYCAGMNEVASVTVTGNAGPGVAENMMSGEVRVNGDVSQSAGASAHGGLLVIGGNASARCGIAIKGVDIVVRGNVGHMSAFMAQAGRLVVCGDAGDALGDSLYEAEIFVRGNVASLGSDCVEKPMDDACREALAHLLDCANVDLSPDEFRRFGSARKLYHFHVDNAY